MRYLNTDHWKSSESLEGLLFFSQLVDEMLFDYTLDSYKPLALNSRLLCIECFETIEEVRNGFIVKRNLQSVIEELKWSLSKDKAAEAIFGPKFQMYVDRLKPNDAKLNEVADIVGFFYNSFNERQYIGKLIEILSELIVSGKNKEHIRSLTGSFITELVNYGYNPNHIYFQNNNFFFNPLKRAKIESPAEIKEFFKIFDFNEKEFTVVFIGNIIFRSFINTMNSYNIVVTKTYNCFSSLQDDLDFKKDKKPNASFIICSKVKAFDHHSAREFAEELLGKISGLINFYHHKAKPEILAKVVVSRTSDNYVVVINKPTKSILKTTSDEWPNEAAKSVQKVLTSLHLDRESTYRFSRSIDLHSAALASTSLENQLLDLWAALETLLPKIMDSNKDRIVQICDSIIPFMQLDYIKKQLIQLIKDMNFWDEKETSEILSQIPNSSGYSELEKIASFVCLESNKNLRLIIYSKLSSYPLLKNRIYSLHESLKTTESINKLLTVHETKINWHIRRIYRVRGLIIHSGKYPSYTSLLIENLHTYLDLFINKIIELSASRKIYTIEQGILETQIALDFQVGLLKKHKGESLTEENFREALLGEKI